MGPEKARDYLLSAVHPVGRFKARVFLALGYSQANWQRFEADLRALALRDGAVPTTATAYGQKYTLRTILSGPSGRSLVLQTVWIVRHGEDFPRLVTAYPEEP